MPKRVVLYGNDGEEREVAVRADGVMHGAQANLQWVAEHGWKPLDDVPPEDRVRLELERLEKN